MYKHSVFSFLQAFIIVFCCLAILPCSDTIQTVYAEETADPDQAAADEAAEHAQVTFSREAGADIEGETVELYAPEGYDIYYTVDGSDPTTASAMYTEPLLLQANSSVLAAESDKINVGHFRIYEDSTLPKAITLKAMAVSSSDGTAGPVATRTYFFQDRESVIVIALSTDYSNLLDYDSGIMVKGAYYDEWVKTPEAQELMADDKTWLYQGNYTQKGKDWERPATIEIFDNLYGQETYILDNCGIRLRGGASRVVAQKSFHINFINGLAILYKVIWCINMGSVMRTHFQLCQIADISIFYTHLYSSLRRRISRKNCTAKNLLGNVIYSHFISPFQNFLHTTH